MSPLSSGGELGMNERDSHTDVAGDDSARVEPVDRPPCSTRAAGCQPLSPLRLSLYVLIAVLAAAAPLAICAARPWVLSGSYEPWRRPFEVLGLTGSLAVALLAFVELRGRATRDRDALIRVGVAALVALFFLAWNVEYAAPSWDYHSYTAAAQAVLDGANPYEQPAPDGPHGPYLYPPLPAEALVAVHQAASVRFGLDRSVYRAMPGWDRIVFYVYQCFQLALVVLAYFLLATLARRLGIAPVPAAALAAVFLVAGNPVLRTLRHSQVNLWLLDLVLVAVLLLGDGPRLSRSRAAPGPRKCDLLAGAAIALAIHIKIYPAILLAPLVFMRRFRAVVACVLVFVAVACVQADFGRDWTIWSQFAGALRDFPRTGSFRASSVPSIVDHTFAAMVHYGALSVPEGDALWSVAPYVRAGLVGLLLIWFAVRLVRRERSWKLETPEQQREGGPVPRFLPHTADMLALALLISPLTWEHHYVLALPLAVWVVASRGRDRPCAVGGALLVLLAVPTFDLYPLSYHRAAALLALLIMTSPGKVRSRDATRGHTGS